MQELNTRDRKKRLKSNTIASLLFQICSIICGFILPRLILQSFGSDVNGVVNSIVQFLGIISFLELGVGAVVQSSLYKPLADQNDIEISMIVASAKKFFRCLSWILIVYVVVLIVFFPLVTKQAFSFLYIATLITAMSIGSFAQYYFGITYQLLLIADQRGYLSYYTQTITLLLNTAVSFILIRLGYSIHIIKLSTAFIYLIRPVFLTWYVKCNYHLIRKIKYEGEPIKQKWNGIAQHVAAVMLNGTDFIILTIFTNFSVVSVYSVYYLVVNGVKQLFLSMTNGLQALLGELWVKQELETLINTFFWQEWVIHTATTYIFGCVSILIVPFIKVYTSGINDTNYTQPLFAVLLTFANAGYCLRLPYHIMIKASGHYKETQSSYIIAILINIVISLFMVHHFGLVGVAIGTLIAMLYQMTWMAFYIYENLIKWPLINFAKQVAVNFITVICMYATTNWVIIPNSNSFLSWLIMAVKTATISGIIVIFINFIFYQKKVVILPYIFKKLIFSK